MAELVNLNKFRKAKARREAEERAAQNRIRHGMPKSERQKARREAERAKKSVDDKRLDE
jgi:hypothetical protein